MVMAALSVGCSGGTGSSAEPSQLSAFSPPPTPATSPAGRQIDVSSLTGRIAFAAGPYPGLDIYIVNANGSNLQRPTSGSASEFDPGWSPDGSRIVYRYEEDQSDATPRTWVMNADGSVRQNLTKGPGTINWGPAWSPDGSRIVWNSDCGHPGAFRGYLMNPDGTHVLELPADIRVEYPAWSPDGRKIAFMAPEPGAQGSDPDYNIDVMNADGSGLARLTRYPGEDGWPAWSPDGRTIAFSSSRDDQGNQRPQPGQFRIYLMSPDGSGQSVLVDTYGQLMDWSPDGNYIVFGGGPALSIVRADGSGLTTLPIQLREPTFPDWIA